MCTHIYTSTKLGNDFLCFQDIFKNKNLKFGKRKLKYQILIQRKVLMNSFSLK